ncbi:MAG: hypothetical protein AAF283_06800, partial [Cyanobacteria bacterium P01_A01_bin.70]
LDIVGSSLLIVVGCAMSLYFILPPSEVANSALGESFFYFDGDRLLSTIGRFFAGYYTVIPNRKRLLDVVLCTLVAISAFVLVSLHLIKKALCLDILFSCKRSHFGVYLRQVHAPVYSALW